MKKILIVSILLFSFALAGVGIAQEAVQSCELARTIIYDGTPYEEGDVVGPRIENYHTVNPNTGEDTYSNAPGWYEEIDQHTEAWAVICSINVINRLTQIAFAIIMALVVILVLVGGFFILTGGANEENVGKGKKFITYAIIGAIVALFAYVVPGLISLIVG